MVNPNSYNLFYDIAIVNDKHEIEKKLKCKYDLNKDISNNIYLTYKKYYSNYEIETRCLEIEKKEALKSCKTEEEKEKASRD